MTYRTVIFRSRTAAMLLLIVSLLAFVALCCLQRVPMADAVVYRAEGAVAAQGGDLYGFTVTEWRLPATYPPFAAILFVPTTWVPFGALKVVFVAGNMALLAVLVQLSCRLAGMLARAPLVCAATAGALWLEPVFQTVLFGQINLALACLVLWDLTRAPGAVGKGFAVGVAAGVKLTPAVFLVYLAVTGRVREAATALVAFLGTVALGALALPSASVDFWTRRLFETDRVGKAWIVDNQSLRGLVARALGDPAPGLAWAVPAAAVAVGGLWLARSAASEARRAAGGEGKEARGVGGGEGSEAQGVVLAAVTALLASPVSWSHHWVWCVPVLALLWAEGRVRTAVVVAALFTARTLWLVPHQGDLDLHLPWWQQLLASPYPLLGSALLGMRAVRHPALRPQTPCAGSSPARSSSASTIR